jgi:hypothetical protein
MYSDITAGALYAVSRMAARDGDIPPPPWRHRAQRQGGLLDLDLRGGEPTEDAALRWRGHRPRRPAHGPSLSRGTPTANRKALVWGVRWNTDAKWAMGDRGERRGTPRHELAGLVHADEREHEQRGLIPAARLGFRRIVDSGI